MARPVDADVFDSPALPLWLRLEAEGFEIQAAEPDTLRVRPLDRVTPELRADLQRHKPALLMLIRTCDLGVQDRREVFARQFAAAPVSAVPRFLFRPSLPYVAGACFSCGERLPRPTFSRCWRCALAWRLACRLPIPVALADALDGAKVVA